MAERDRPAVDVDLRCIPAEILVDGAGLRGERLVRFDQIEIADSPAGLLERGARRRDRSGAHDTMRASGFLPRLAASLAFISTTAAAPSLMPDAFAAVTVPSLAKAGRSLAIVSSVVPCLGCSSLSTTISPLRVFTVTGAISSLNFPAFCAASALFCDATANSSCCARVICHWRATFSAVLPM